jgi:hypothetical protein
MNSLLQHWRNVYLLHKRAGQQSVQIKTTKRLQCNSITATSQPRSLAKWRQTDNKFRPIISVPFFSQQKRAPDAGVIHVKAIDKPSAIQAAGLVDHLASNADRRCSNDCADILLSCKRATTAAVNTPIVRFAAVPLPLTPPCPTFCEQASTRFVLQMAVLCPKFNKRNAYIPIWND